MSVHLLLKRLAGINRGKILAISALFLLWLEWFFWGVLAGYGRAPFRSFLPVYP